MKEITGDEPIGIMIHIYLEISQENSPCSYLYLKQAEMSFFFLFSSTKLENRMVEQVLPGCVCVCIFVPEEGRMWGRMEVGG
jgi:hypothetical protein